MSKEKIIAIVVVVVVILAGVGYKMYSKPKAEVSVAPKAEVVAIVNGVEITKPAYETQLATVIAALKTQGVNTDDATASAQIKTNVVNDMIASELIKQAAASAGVSASADDVQKQVEAIISQLGGSDKFAAELAKQGLTEAKLRENLTNQLTIQKYLLTKIDVSSATATDAEVTKYYNDNVKGKAGAPTLKDSSAQIKQFIINTKQQSLLAAFVETLKKTAKIEVKI